MKEHIHLQVMPNYNYLLFLLLCFVIYVSTLGAASRSAPVPLPYRPCERYDQCRDTIVDNSTLTQGESMTYGGSLISENGTFKLGFFVRGGNTYLGIWYNATNPEVIVWVANRDKPIPPQPRLNYSVVLGEGDGIARLLDSNNHCYWSADPPSQTSSGDRETVLQLKENGNLNLMVIKRGTRSEVLWQSFTNSTDTLLKDQWSSFGSNTPPILTSWKDPDNPAVGDYILQIDSSNSTDKISLSLYKNKSLYWVSTDSSYPLPTGLTSLVVNGTTNTSMIMRLVLNSSGIIQLWALPDNSSAQNWSISWTAPIDQCDLYARCGRFGVCDAGNGFMCKCLPGFVPITNDSEIGETNEFTDCTKRTSDTCGDVFLSFPLINVPPDPDIDQYRYQSEESCKGDCQKDCRCKAYSFDPHKFNCKLWNKDLYSIQEEYYNPDNRTLSIRVSPSDIDFGKRACNICGTNVIPYPLSTNSSCGDPNYFNFHCNSSNGQVYFRPTLGGNLYKVSHINEAGMKFVVQLQHHGGTSKCDTTNNIESKLFVLSNSSPFSVTYCSVVQLLGRPVVEEVELSWNVPKPPTCRTSSDCDDWPHTTCYQDAKVCMCGRGFHSDSQFLNCTKVDDHKGISLWVKIGVASTCGMVLLGTIFVILCLQKRRAKQRPGITEIKTNNDIEDIDIPFVDYESILYATDNFSDANKLGVGGFGPVYKGKLVDGSAVAIKRLSAASAQGVEEFRNEVILIAKLQHRNLVRVLGYCAKENEKILIYEYMPNKSLDAFLFDHTISPMLDWTKRFNIIMGIARGLLYLHQDSRLIIIHRDLKPSNILLDGELNPKISDFGLARIVEWNEMAATTARIIGTHGYMSPEYALDGYFSIKSDVYSFGIVVLEIISGKRCASLLPFENNLITLLGYAWFLWDQGNPMELVDESVKSYDASEVKRCINVGLLCVQEDPSDRPTMSTVLLMLSGDSMNLPYPKQPVFVARRPPSESTSSSNKFKKSGSNVELTTTIEGR